jgi:hypothetical protein
VPFGNKQLVHQSPRKQQGVELFNPTRPEGLYLGVILGAIVQTESTWTRPSEPEHSMGDLRPSAIDADGPDSNEIGACKGCYSICVTGAGEPVRKLEGGHCPLLSMKRKC